MKNIVKILMKIILTLTNNLKIKITYLNIINIF